LRAAKLFLCVSSTVTYYFVTTALDSISV